MSCYLDTSLLVPLLIREPGTPRVQALFENFAACGWSWFRWRQLI